MAAKKIYKITFMNQGQVYEIYAKNVSQGNLFGFIEVAEIVFGEKTKVVVDPSEERLKTEFSGVRRTYIPMHAVIRIDEVEKEGSGTIRSTTGDDQNVTAFPMPVYPDGKGSGNKN